MPRVTTRSCRSRDPEFASLELPDGRRIDLRIVRSCRCRLALTVDREGRVTLRLPAAAELGVGVRFAESRAGWVARHLDWRPPPAPLAHGATLWLGGLPRRLFVEPAAGRPAIEDDGVFLIYVGAPDRLRSTLITWYRRRARLELTPRVERWAIRMDEAMPRLAFGDPRGRWGSCNARLRKLNLSWRLLMLPDDLADSVIIHELAHLAVPDHSPRFWRRVEAFDPLARDARRHLRDWDARIRWGPDPDRPVS